MVKKLVALLTVTALSLLVLLTGCSSSSSSTAASGDSKNSNVTITLWTWPDNDKTFEKTIPLFEKLHPNIHVKVQAFDGKSYAQKVLTSLVSGSGPDVAMINWNEIPHYKDKPGFVDLSKSPYNAGQLQKNYASFAWSQVANPKTGAIIALPKNTGPGAMFYRKDLFQKAGLPTDPVAVHKLLSNWNDFIAVGKKLTIPGKQWMVSDPTQMFGAIQGEAGISYFDKNNQLQINNTSIKQSFGITKQAYDSGIISPLTDWSNEWTAGIKNGEFAVQFWGNWFGGMLKTVYDTNGSGKWGVTYAPAFNENTSFQSGGDFIGILETSKYKQADWEFIQWVTQNNDSLKTMYEQNDLYPAWTPALKSSWLNRQDSYFGNQNVNNIFSDVSSKMIPFNFTHTNDIVAQTGFGNVTTDITKGKLSVSDAIAKEEKYIKANEK